MLKRISPSQVELGMFVHKLEGSWFKHPFWKSKFVLNDPATLEDLRDADIDGVVIDISKGRDVLVRRGDAPQDRPAPAAKPQVAAQRRQFAGQRVVHHLLETSGVAASEIVVTVTTSEEPVFPGKAARPGACRNPG